MKTRTCCIFHFSGGDMALSCGGDIVVGETRHTGKTKLQTVAEIERAYNKALGFYPSAKYLKRDGNQALWVVTLADEKTGGLGPVYTVRTHAMCNAKTAIKRAQAQHDAQKSWPNCINNARGV